MFYPDIASALHRPDHAIMAIIGHKEEFGDPRLSKIAETDSKKWYQKPNLRMLYLILVPCGLGVEWTSGFDSSMMNSLQAVQSWVDCTCCPGPQTPTRNSREDGRL